MALLRVLAAWRHFPQTGRAPLWSVCCTQVCPFFTDSMLAADPPSIVRSRAPSLFCRGVSLLVDPLRCVPRHVMQSETSLMAPSCWWEVRTRGWMLEGIVIGRSFFCERVWALWYTREPDQCFEREGSETAHSCQQQCRVGGHPHTSSNPSSSCLISSSSSSFQGG